MFDLATEVAGVYVPELTVVRGDAPDVGRLSDHLYFWDYGYSAIFLHEDFGQPNPYLHTYDDVVGVSYNCPTLAERSTKLAVALVATMAEPFSLAIRHTPLEDTEYTGSPCRVVTMVVADGIVNQDSLLLHYSDGSGMNTLTLTPTGNPDEFEAFIPLQPAGTFVDYYLVAEDTEGRRKVHPRNAPADFHTFFVGTVVTVFEDDFESDLGWTVGAPDDDATAGIWNRCDPQWTPAQPENDFTPAPGVNAYFTVCRRGTSQMMFDVDGGRTTLLSPLFDLSEYSHALMSYRRWYSNNTGNNPDSDIWQVDISDDGGASWVSLENTNQSIQSWIPQEFYINEYIDLTDQVRVRFVASDEAPEGVVEAGVDEFSIIGYVESATAVAKDDWQGTRRVELSQNVPNPFNPMTTIRFSVPTPGRKVSLRVFDVTGRHVAALLDNDLVSGSRTVQWDGKDHRGVEVSTGIYFYRLDAGEETLTRKMVLIQ
jgi:hypothetical protein